MWFYIIFFSSLHPNLSVFIEGHGALHYFVVVTAGHPLEYLSWKLAVFSSRLTTLLDFQPFRRFQGMEQRLYTSSFLI
jgi:hypothetical protein